MRNIKGGLETSEFEILYDVMTRYGFCRTLLTLLQGFPTWGTCTPGGIFAYPKGYI